MSENASQSSSFRFSLGDLMLLVTYLAILMANIGALLPELGPEGLRMGSLAAVGGLIGFTLSVVIGVFGRRRYSPRSVGQTRVRLRQCASWRFHFCWLAALTLFTVAVKIGGVGISRELTGFIAVFWWLCSSAFLVLLIRPPVTCLHERGLFDESVFGPSQPWPWSAVQVKQWDREETRRLILGVGWRRMRLRVPEELRDQVDALLREKLGYGEDESAQPLAHGKMSG